ncbi:zinc ABC transporter substrate-binding protein [Lactococcus fujiensis JCM 16395]|uniref:Zinc ABC transporter substrate-binding protein n=1 Tax=Lactococcus fujiensis JCM 16395 TaxID=1291764 RepID=A0A2A5RMQ0_9LACT|nr:zinc ABC transporter substrate-binding protein [Lactococcus fujiensis JCM 16395]
MLTVLFVLTACQKSTAKPEIITSFEPMYEFTKAIVGDKVEIKNIVPSNQEVHDYEPSAKDMATMSAAKVIIYNSDDLEKWVKNAQGKEAKIEASTPVTKIAGDPHTWVSPKEAILEVQYIADQLSNVFPQYKSDFEKNASAYLTKLKKLDAEFDTLKDAKQKVFITQHEAFSYLARDYGMKQIAITGLDPESEPSASALATLKSEMEKAGLKHVYFEDNSTSAIAETLAKSAGASLLVINPVEGLSDAQKKAGDNYLTIMQENLKSLQKTIK